MSRSSHAKAELSACLGDLMDEINSVQGEIRTLQNRVRKLRDAAKTMEGLVCARELEHDGFENMLNHFNASQEFLCKNITSFSYRVKNANAAMEVVHIVLRIPKVLTSKEMYNLVRPYLMGKLLSYQDEKEAKKGVKKDGKKEAESASPSAQVDLPVAESSQPKEAKNGQKSPQKEEDEEEEIIDLDNEGEVDLELIEKSVNEIIGLVPGYVHDSEDGEHFTFISMKVPLALHGDVDKLCSYMEDRVYEYYDYYHEQLADAEMHQLSDKEEEEASEVVENRKRKLPVIVNFDLSNPRHLSKVRRYKMTGELSSSSASSSSEETSSSSSCISENSNQIGDTAADKATSSSDDDVVMAPVNGRKDEQKDDDIEVLPVNSASTSSSAPIKSSTVSSKDDQDALDALLAINTTPISSVALGEKVGSNEEAASVENVEATSKVDSAPTEENQQALDDAIELLLAEEPDQVEGAALAPEEQLLSEEQMLADEPAEGEAKLPATDQVLSEEQMLADEGELAND